MDQPENQLGLNQAPPDVVPRPVLPMDAPLDPPVKRYCSTCGGLRDADGICPACVASVIQSSAEESSSSQFGQAIRYSLVLYFSLLAVSAFGMIAAALEADEIVLDFGVTIGMSIVVAIAAAIFWRDAILPLLKPARAIWFFAAIGAGMITFTLATLFLNALHTYFELEILRYSDAYLDSGFGWGMVMLMIAVQPAIFEEVAFRGIILNSVQPVLNATEAVLVSSMMFMILHLSPASFPHTFLLGLAAGFLRLRTGSLLPCVLMHFVHNSLCIAAEYAGY